MKQSMCKSIKNDTCISHIRFGIYEQYPFLHLNEVTDQNRPEMDVSRVFEVKMPGNCTKVNKLRI